MFVADNIYLIIPLYSRMEAFIYFLWYVAFPLIGLVIGILFICLLVKWLLR